MATATLDASTGRRTWLDQLLSVVAEVRAGEAVTALLLTFTAFLLLGSYYFGIKPVREALILSVKGGAELKSYTGAVQAGLFLFLVPAYSAFASKVNRRRLINGVFLFFISHLVIFFALGEAGVPLGVPFFLWAGIFNVMCIAQFWSFANDLYTPEEGKRLFAIIVFGTATGSVCGSEAASLMGKRIDVFTMMLVSAGILLLCVLLMNLVHSREKGRTQNAARRREVEEPLGKEGGFHLVIHQRYLLFIGLLIFTLNLVNTNGEYMLGRMFGDLARRTVAAGAAAGLDAKQLLVGYYAQFQFWQNAVGTVIQFFLVSRIMKYIGVRAALFIMPALSLCGYSLFAAIPALAVIRLVKIEENSMDYTLNNTVRQALFLPTSREAKYKAKQAVETFFWRAGDMISALLVFSLVRRLDVGRVSAINAGLVFVWLLLVFGIAREHRKLTAALPPEAV
ncbi:MAG TPA: Npt1/Npt2 family nucleotide transporter [Bryobacterales bacterium]|nr:Npt1/Npt2 family nucleotide transporter [Bryobacterales bacterium]